MSQATLDTERIVRLLLADAMATLGEHARAEVLAVAASLGENAHLHIEHGDTLAEAQRFFDREVVDRFQQSVHDLYWDTTWPACPRHPKHPLWYDEERKAWCCQQDGSAIAPLGGLTGLRSPAT
jgi:hypothetical protein